MTSITNDHSVSTDDNESKRQVVLPTAKKPYHNVDDSNNDHHHMDINAKEDDDTRHMNDSTIPPPKNMTPPSNMPPPKSKKITTTTNTRPTANPRVATTTTNFKTPAEIAMGRRKTPTALGLGDWMRLLSVTKDIAQLKGQSIRRNITKQEVQQHRTIHDGWIILHNTRVYNISPYLSYHPGGINIMKSVLGKDATTLFQKYHPWVNIDGLIVMFAGDGFDENECVKYYKAYKRFLTPAVLHLDRSTTCNEWNSAATSRRENCEELKQHAMAFGDVKPVRTAQVGNTMQEGIL